MTLMCISSAKETPKMPSDEQCLNSVAESVVDMCFAVPNTHEVLTANAAEEVDYPCCICNEEMDDKAIMVGCGNIHCPNGEWFHPHCLNMAPTDIPVGDWFCCEDCERASIAPMGSAAAVKKKNLQRNPDTQFDHTNSSTVEVCCSGISCTRPSVMRCGRMMVPTSSGTGDSSCRTFFSVGTQSISFLAHVYS